MMNMLYKISILFLCLLAFPLQAIISVLIFVFYGFPIFFLQRRVGKGGKWFLMYKYRTMIIGADTMQSKYRRENISDGPVFKIPHDPRFTPFGKFLSHTGLDELPQLWNVLKGEMALVGPRPLPVDEAKKLKPWMQKRQDILPGIISPAILSGKYHENFEAWMKSDVAYVSQKSPLVDVRLAVRSIHFLFLLLSMELARVFWRQKVH